MRITLRYFISIFFLLAAFNAVKSQDTIQFPLKFRVGLEVSGPVLYYTNRNIYNIEGYASYDLNEKYSAVIGGGYLDYKYSQYNYNYLNKGSFVRAGVDINLIKPKKSMGKYWGGIGLKYGISRYTSEVPEFTITNYWGSFSSSIPKQTSWGHFIEVSPGVRAEILRGVSIGWTISVRKMIYSGTGKDLRPIYMPGYGNGSKSLSAGLSYFLVWNFGYRKKQIIIRKEEPEDEEDTINNQNNNNINNNNLNNGNFNNNNFNNNNFNNNNGQFDNNRMNNQFAR